MKKSMLIGMILVTLLFPMRLIHAQPESNGDPGDEIRRIAEDQLDNLNIDQWNEYKRYRQLSREYFYQHGCKGNDS